MVNLEPHLRKMGKIQSAAMVIAKTYHIRKYLENHDPKALEQLDKALELTPEEIERVKPIGPPNTKQYVSYRDYDPDWDYEEED